MANRINNYFINVLEDGEHPKSLFSAGKKYSMAAKIDRVLNGVAPIDDPLFKRIDNQLTEIGKACDCISDILDICIDFLTSFVTRTKAGKIHGGSYTAIQRYVTMLCDKLIPSLNASIVKLNSLFLDVTISPIELSMNYNAWNSNQLGILLSIMNQVQGIIGKVELAFTSQFSQDAWSSTREKLFPSKIPENYFVLKYDVKGSQKTGDAQRLTRLFMGELDARVSEGLSEYIKRETIVKVKDPNEDGLFLARSSRELSMLTLRLLQLAEDNHRRLRIAISSTTDTNRPFHRKRKYVFDDNYRLIIRPNEDNEIDENFILSQRLLDSAEEIENRKENKTDQIVKELNDEIHTVVLSQQTWGELQNLTSNMDFIKRRFRIPKECGRTYQSLVILPDYINAFINSLKKLL